MSSNSVGRHAGVRRHHDLEQAVLAGRRQRLHVALEHRLEGLRGLPLGVLGGQRLDAVEGEDELGVHRLLAHSVPSLSKTAIRSAAGTKSGLAGIGDAGDEIENRLFWRSRRSTTAAGRQSIRRPVGASAPRNPARRRARVRRQVSVFFASFLLSGSGSGYRSRSGVEVVCFRMFERTRLSDLASRELPRRQPEAKPGTLRRTRLVSADVSREVPG